MTAVTVFSRGEAVAELLLRVGAVAIRVDPPFRYRSGMLSPIYTDNRLLCSYPNERRLIAGYFAELLAEQSIVPDVLAGVATAGIPHAAWLAERLELPMVYVRGEAKDHGKGKRVEGALRPRSDPLAGAANAPALGERPAPNVVVIEDLVTTGGGALDAVAGVRAEGGQVSDCLAICTYDFPQAAAAFAAAGVTLHPLCTYDNLAAVALRLQYVAPADLALVLDWRADPAGWAARHDVHLDV
jgi:orotate phosphoribosyltransferase